MSWEVSSQLDTNISTCFLKRKETVESLFLDIPKDNS